MDLRITRLLKIRALPRSEQSLRALVKRVPKAEALAGKIIERLRPACSSLYGARRRVATAGVVLLTAWLFIHVMFGANGMVVYRQKKTDYNALQSEIDELQKENERYTHQIKSLKTDPMTIEKEAREQLHYARPGEVVYVTPAPVSPQKPANNAAKK